ncbi:hypothetical protein LG943_15970 [Streptomonospora sp. S1-112]|uniref:DUF4190 domain-containing protein n=1 Tax=Streptomonospora mangrovi TaxID=2883123 RepID=A0A9X3SFB2_9ACTN|nr:hypothetical protein [Streptomonospora mangrovi]MDA0565797.1 hypothetical protein [Streptomonospora mangrovi]
MPSDDEHGARQGNTESWFRPSGDRHRSQAQYQETFSDNADGGDDAERGAPGAPGAPAPEAPRQEPGAPVEPERPRPTFPSTGGYPGLRGERPGMAEPYPSALGDLGGAPPAPPGPPTGDQPSPIRPYAAPAQPADRPGPAEAGYDLGTGGQAAAGAPGEGAPRPGAPAPGAAGADSGVPGGPTGGYPRPGGERPGDPGSPLSALGGGTGGYPGFGSTVRGGADQAPGGPAESLWPGRDGSVGEPGPGRPSDRRPAADGPDTAPFASTGLPAPGETDPRPWDSPSGAAEPRPWDTPAADTERPPFGDRPAPGVPADRPGAGERAEPGAGAERSPFGAGPEPAGERPAFGERTEPASPPREWPGPAQPSAGDPLAASGGRPADGPAPWDSRPGSPHTPPAAADATGAPGERPAFGGDAGERPSYGADLGERPSYGAEARERPYGGDQGERSPYSADAGERPSYGGEAGEGPSYGAEAGERPSYGGDPLGGFADDSRRRSAEAERGAERGLRADTPAYGDPLSDPAGAPGERPAYGADAGERPAYGGDPLARPGADDPADRWSRPRADFGAPSDAADPAAGAPWRGGDPLADDPRRERRDSADPLGEDYGRTERGAGAWETGARSAADLGAPSGGAERGFGDDPYRREHRPESGDPFGERSSRSPESGDPLGDRARSSESGAAERSAASWDTGARPASDPGDDPLGREPWRERRESGDPLGEDYGRTSEWGTGAWATGARSAADPGAPSGGAERDSGDGYDDELSRPYSSRIPTDDDSGAPAPGYRPSGAPADGPAAGDPGADRRADDPARADSGLGGDLGTGSGNTWAFSRDDERLPESIRQAAAEAQRKRRDGSPEHTTQMFRSGGDTGGDRPDAGSWSGTPVTDLGDDPLAAIAAQQARARSDGPESPAHGDDPRPADTGWGEDPGPGTQAMPAIADELGPDLRESRYGERPGEEQPGARGWAEREHRPADEGGPSTQAMPAVSDELGPDLRDDARRDPLGDDRGAPWAAEDPAAHRDRGYGAEPGGGYDREHGAPGAPGAPGGDRFGAPYGQSGGDPLGAPDHRTQAFPSGGYPGGPESDYGRAESADPWRREPEAPSPYLDGGAEYPQGHRDGGEYGAPARQGYADTPYGDPRERPEPGGPRDSSDDPYGTRHQEPYSREHGEHGDYGDHAGQGGYGQPGEYGGQRDEYGERDDYGDDRPGRGAEPPARRGRSGRDPVADDFPGFDDRPPGAAAGDAYPGYDNIDYWPETAPGAATTLWLGIIGLVPVIGLFTAIAALVTGPRARRAIQRSNGELEGLNLVRGGTITAWVGIGLFLVEAVVFVGTTVLS